MQINKNSKKFSTKILLSKQFVLPSKYDLYNIGFASQRLNDGKETNNHKVFRLFLMISMFLYIIFKINLVIYSSNENISILLGEGILHFPSIKFHINISSIALAITSLYIQIENNFMVNSFSFLNVFKMLSGFKTPAQIGLTNSNDIVKLSKR